MRINISEFNSEIRKISYRILGNLFFITIT